MRFKKSKIYLSAIPVVGLGFGIGILTSVMGVGGGFIMVPAMIYLLRIRRMSSSEPRCSRLSS